MGNNIQSMKGMLSRIFLFLSVVLLLGVTVACQHNDDVVYEINGDADTVTIKCWNDTGSYDDYQDVSLPWRVEYGHFEGNYVYLYAWNTGDSGSMTASVYVNGRLYQSSTSSGPGQTLLISGDKDRP